MKEQLYDILAITYNREMSDFTRLEYNETNASDIMIRVHASEIFQRQQGLIRELCKKNGYDVSFCPGTPGIHYINIFPL
jgi:hypothetical protein